MRASASIVFAASTAKWATTAATRASSLPQIGRRCASARVRLEEAAVTAADVEAGGVGGASSSASAIPAVHHASISVMTGAELNRERRDCRGLFCTVKG